MTKTFEQIVSQNGFAFEEHSVTTPDFYTLKVFRIPGSNTSHQVRGKPVVFLQHGLLDSADAWVMHKPSLAPAFVLAKAGYDVWLGNSRGNKYSHSSSVQMETKDFWNIGYENMGDGDITTEIEYVLKVTKQEKLAYIGHSQGTSQMYWALSHNEEFFAKRVSVFIALGPVMRLDHCRSDLIKTFAQYRQSIVDTCNFLGLYEFFPANWLSTGSMRMICGIVPQLCQQSLYLISDEDTSLLDEARSQVYFGHYPSGTSLRTLDHYA